MEAFINEMVEPRVLDLLVRVLPKWRLLVYTFLTHVLLFAPVYFFGVILINDADLTLICPSAVLYGCNLMQRAALRRSPRNNTRSLLTGAGFLCLGISTGGLVAIYADTNSANGLLVVLLYGIVGGYGYQLFFSRLWKLLGKAFNVRKELFVVTFLQSCGQALTLPFLILAFQVPWTDCIHGSLLVLLAGIVLHLVPVTLLLESEKNFLKGDVDSLVRITQKGNESFYNDVVKCVAGASMEPGALITSEVDHTEPPAVTWRNPATFGYQDNELELAEHSADIEYDDEQLYPRDGKYFNQDGVEILEMIAEEDEENMAAYEADSLSPTGPGCTKSSVLVDKWNLCGHLVHGISWLYRSIELRGAINMRLFESVRIAVRDFQFYCCLLLKSADLCIFVLFLAILPKFSAYHYHQRSKARQMALLSITVIAVSWAMAALLLLWCDLKFRKQQERLLIFGVLFKAFGYFCVYSIKSSFWTITGCMLIGVGHAIACSYQDLVIKRKFSARQWNTIKDGLYLLSGLGVVVFATVANLLYIHWRIDNLLLLLLLCYCAAGSFWLVCNYRFIFR